VQCTHQERFGRPCKLCRRNKDNFPIYELDCGSVRGVDDVKNFIATSAFDIVGAGKKKVFIFDEAHRLSGHAQDSLLKSFEDKGNALWIICSTKHSKIVDTLRSRCKQYPLKPLNREDTGELVKYLLLKNASELSVDDLADALVDNKVDSCRLIANAVDDYISGCSADEAAQVEGTTEVDSKALCRATVKGLWTDVSDILQKTSEGDLRFLRSAVINYLRSVLLESPEINDRTSAVAEAIKRLSYVTTAEDSIQLAALSAELFTLCKLFSEYSV
jgi:DNA polymerase III gamma/tau subunit